MIFTATPLAGAFVVSLETIDDGRGFFARAFCAETFAARGLEPKLDQISVSYNRQRGILRGMHMQRAPHGETKLVRCTAGTVFDVIVDLRRESETFGRWFGLELSAANRQQLYIPQGFAHGFQTLSDGAELAYHISTPYVPAAQVGLRWNDPTVGIAWPLPNTIMSDRDRSLPALDRLEL
jgi:dTDP-4-dehydrorhamnose 3,5-epimerase